MDIFWLTKNDIFPRSFSPFLKEHDITIGHVCTNPQTAIQGYLNNVCDMVVMDFSWYCHSVSGLALLENFLKIDPCLDIVLVTSYYQDIVNTRYRSLGASGYFNKNDTPENIIECIKISCRNLQLHPMLHQI